MRTRLTARLTLLAAVCALALGAAGCGGGGGSSSDDNEEESTALNWDAGNWDAKNWQ